MRCFAAFLVAAAAASSSAWAEEAPGGMDTVSSSDKLHLTYVPRMQSRLFGMPGTTVRIQLKLKNKALEGAYFKINVISSNTDFMGDYPALLEVRARDEGTIEISDLEVPDVPEGTVIRLTVQATKRSELNNNPTYGEDMVEIKLLFTVGNAPEDEVKPEVSYDYGNGCTVNANDTETCDQQKWDVNFNVKDTGSGLSSVSVRGPFGRETLEHPLEYSHDNFEVGTKNTVRVSTKASCCLASIQLRAIDLTGEEYTNDFAEGAGAGSISAPMAFATLTLLALAISRVNGS